MTASLVRPPAPRVAPHLVAALQAIAEPNRARIISLLGHGEHCVCDVGDVLGLSPALVSHHLRVLRSSGLLRERKSGRWMYYSLDLENLALLRAAILDLLTPRDAALTACVCSDCGQSPAPSKDAAVSLLSLPDLAGAAP
jgi:ArsR family transcriptional regulator